MSFQEWHQNTDYVIEAPAGTVRPVKSKAPAKRTLARTIIVSGATALVGTGGYFLLFRIHERTVYHAWPWFASHNAGLIAIIGVTELTVAVVAVVAIIIGIVILFEMADWA
jgi:hypothetical protein